MCQEISTSKVLLGSLEQRKWESLKKKRKDNILIMFYKDLNGAASIPLLPQIGVPRIIIPWNFKPHHLSECTCAEVSVT